MTIITYDCPGCGASVKINPDHTSATCEYCGTHFAIESEKKPEFSVWGFDSVLKMESQMEDEHFTLKK